MPEPTVDVPAPPPPDTGSEFARLGGPVWLVLGILALLYWLPNYAYHGDGIADAADVLTRNWFAKFHVHHLGYTPAMWVLWKLLGAVGLDWHPNLVLTVVSRCSTIGSCLVAALLFRRYGLAPSWTALFLALYGLSFANWNYGTIASVYPPTMLLLLLVYRHLASWMKTPPDERQYLKVGALIFVATMFHQLAILVTIPTVAWAWITAAHHNEDQLKEGLRALRIAIVPSAIAYLVILVGYFQVSSIPEFVEFILLYGTQETWQWFKQIPPGATFSGTLISHLLESHGRLFWAMPLPMPMWEPFTQSSSIPFVGSLQALIPEVIYRVLYTLVLPLLFVALCVYGVQVWNTTPRVRPAITLALWWIAPFFAFSLYYMPQIAFYRLDYLVPLLLIAALILAHVQPPSLRAGFGSGLIAFLTLTAYSNLVHGILPRLESANNPYLPGIAAMAERPPGAILVEASRSADWLYFQYAVAFSGREVFTYEVPAPEDLARFSEVPTYSPTDLVTEFGSRLYLFAPVDTLPLTPAMLGDADRRIVCTREFGNDTPPVTFQFTLDAVLPDAEFERVGTDRFLVLTVR